MRQRRKKRFFRLLCLWVLILLVLLVGLIFLSRIPSLQISAFDISGTTSLDDAAIRAEASAAASGYYFWVLPKSDIFLYPAAAMPEKLVADFPEISSATVDRKGLSAIEIRVTEKKPSALWCGQSPDAPQSPCLLLDPNGEAYKPAPVFSESPYFEYFGALATTSLPSAFLPPARYESLGALAASLSDIFPSVSAYATPDGDIELRNSSGTVVKIAVQDDYAETARYFRAFLNGAALGSAENDPDKFDSIDMRFGKRVYYRLKAPAIIGSASSSPAVHS